MKKLFAILSFVFLLSELCFSQETIKTCVIRFQNCQLFESPNSEAIVRIKKGRTVDVIDVVDGYYKVIYNGKTGYIVDTFLNDPELNAMKERVKKVKILEETKKQEEMIMEKKTQLVNKYGVFHANCIMAHKVVLGMTTEEVKLSWGRPDDINRTSNVYTTSEQWVYRGDNFKNSYLYFNDGILETIQD